jgi:hypothetical protein
MLVPRGTAVTVPGANVGVGTGSMIFKGSFLGLLMKWMRHTELLHVCASLLSCQLCRFQENVLDGSVLKSL